MGLKLQGQKLLKYDSKACYVRWHISTVLYSRFEIFWGNVVTTKDGVVLVVQNSPVCSGR
jgi:hypothetical protein